MWTLDAIDAPVDTTIADGDEMFERHAPPDQAWNHYFSCGRSALRAIRLALAAAGTPSVRRILDLPCGHGRVLRVLKSAFPTAELHACDLEKSGVDFCAKQFGARPIYSHPEPRKIGLEGRYDLIWVGSLMTHLDASRWPGFLTLFRDSLATGGVCVFTVHGQHAAKLIESGMTNYGLNRATDLLRPYQRKGFAYSAYPGQEYGISLSSLGWVCGQLAKLPESRLVMYTERGWADHQDVVATAAAA